MSVATKRRARKSKNQNGEPQPRSLVDICKDLQESQRLRAVYIKSRIMISNRIQAIVAGEMGYRSGLSEGERKKLFQEAGKAIKEGRVPKKIEVLVEAHVDSIEGFRVHQDQVEKYMLSLVKQLPKRVLDWVKHDDQKGFGILFLAIVIGECGDLGNYANPAKVWRRLGCAPYTKGDETLMGATWRGRGKGKGSQKLHASDWEEFGYSPRRRSISYLIGEAIVKANGSGPYRSRYNSVKKAYPRKHPDRVKCPECKGSGRGKRSKCPKCKGSGKLMKRAHLHSMLLATKLLLKSLWAVWNNYPPKGVL
jgi:hypothetical protein